MHQPELSATRNDMDGSGLRIGIVQARFNPAITGSLAQACLDELKALHVDATDPGSVRLYFSAPAEAPTTRGFASILAAGLDGQPVADILAVPDDFYAELGLAALISPLRLRGMSAMLTRIKRRLRAAG